MHAGESVCFSGVQIRSCIIMLLLSGSSRLQKGKAQNHGGDLGGEGRPEEALGQGRREDEKAGVLRGEGAD